MIPLRTSGEIEVVVFIEHKRALRLAQMFASLASHSLQVLILE